MSTLAERECTASVHMQSMRRIDGPGLEKDCLSRVCQQLHSLASPALSATSPPSSCSCEPAARSVCRGVHCRLAMFFWEEACQPSPITSFFCMECRCVGIVSRPRLVRTDVRMDEHSVAPWIGIQCGHSSCVPVLSALAEMFESQ